MKPATIKIWATGNHDWTTGSWNAEECDGRFSPQQFEYTLSSHAAAPLWQPIETAPKDGTDILIGGDFCYAGGVVMVSYAGEDVQAFVDMDGDVYDSATHWMPLPKPPEATP